MRSISNIYSDTQSANSAGIQGIAVLSGNASSSGVMGDSPAGIQGMFYHASTGTVTDAVGIVGALMTDSSVTNGTITRGAGSVSIVLHESDGIIDDAAGMLIGAAQNTGGGTITNNYGLYVENQTAGDNDVGVYIEGAEDYALHVDSGVSRFDDLLELTPRSTPGVVCGPTTEGSIYYDADDSDLCICDGGDWEGVFAGAACSSI